MYAFLIIIDSQIRIKEVQMRLTRGKNTKYENWSIGRCFTFLDCFRLDAIQKIAQTLHVPTDDEGKVQLIFNDIILIHFHWISSQVFPFTYKI